MGEYKAPLKDMDFVLNHVVGLDELSRMDAFAHAESDVVAAVLEEASKLAGNVLSPLNKAGDLAGTSVKDGVVTSPDGWQMLTVSLLKAAGTELQGRKSLAAAACLKRLLWQVWRCGMHRIWLSHFVLC
ncbi:acyl-CoA dehydrogenase N-terminal domain-containing protein [Sneathiella glossodoripedis]|uniref:acyl-CoA dehydrogenase N-terminal domain-containing protein n=1 Tax=Sneathiella glossodoripedis TaxID=418853 RepID=UPI001F177BCD|nr:acyl-CoA dehydrogenase N-terminal domain-containing protein [Sneathiella glossodoripedis]